MKIDKYIWSKKKNHQVNKKPYQAYEKRKTEVWKWVPKHQPKKATIPTYIWVPKCLTTSITQPSQPVQKPRQSQPQRKARSTQPFEVKQRWIPKKEVYHLASYEAWVPKSLLYNTKATTVSTVALGTSLQLTADQYGF